MCQLFSFVGSFGLFHKIPNFSVIYLIAGFKPGYSTATTLAVTKSLLLMNNIMEYHHQPILNDSYQLKHALIYLILFILQTKIIHHEVIDHKFLTQKEYFLNQNHSEFILIIIQCIICIVKRIFWLIQWLFQTQLMPT